MAALNTPRWPNPGAALRGVDGALSTPFPSHPACGNVLPCAECAEECGGDAGCFNDCVQAEPACSSCLQPFFTCQGEGGDCTEQFCACTPDEGC